MGGIEGGRDTVEKVGGQGKGTSVIYEMMEPMTTSGIEPAEQCQRAYRTGDEEIIDIRMLESKIYVTLTRGFW